MTATAAKPLKILLQTTIPYAEDDWYSDAFRCCATTSRG